MTDTPWINDVLPAIEQAKRLREQIDQLYVQMNELLDPVAQKATSAPQEELVELISLLPQGFHRSELRTLFNQREGSLQAKNGPSI